MAILGLFAVCLTNSWCWRQAKSIGMCFFQRWKRRVCIFLEVNIFSSKYCVFVGDVFFGFLIPWDSSPPNYHFSETKHLTELFPSIVARGKSKNMTPPNRWCGAQSSISQAESRKSRPKPGAVDKKMLENSLVLVKRFPLDFCEQVAGWFIEIFKWLIVTPIQLGRISSIVKPNGWVSSSTCPMKNNGVEMALSRGTFVSFLGWWNAGFVFF